MRKKQFITFFIVSLLFLFFGFSKSVAGATDLLPPGVVVGDDSGIQVGEDGKYFIEHTDIKPGLTFVKEITISNYAQKASSYTLQLDMKKDRTSGEINLLDAISVVLELEGKEIYRGTIGGDSETGSNKPPLDLGDYSSGTTRTMVATFTVASDLPDEMWKKANSADFWWGFYASNREEPGTTQEPEPNPKPDQPSDSKPSQKKPFSGILPQTGEDWQNVLLGICVGIVIMMVMLVVAKRNKERSSHQ